MVPDFEDIGLKICPAIGNTVFGVGIGITHEQEGNATVGHFQDDGVPVDVFREGGSGVADRDGQRSVQYR